MDIREMMGREVRRQGMENVLLCIRMCSEADIDRLGPEVVAGIYSDRCGGDDRRSALMCLGTVGQAHAQLKMFRDRLAADPDMAPEVGALDAIVAFLLDEGGRMAGRIGGEYLAVEMEIERSMAGRDICDICTLAFMYDLTNAALEQLEAIE